ncbi:restriction endonuclease subunit S [Alcanivorax sp. IL2]|uniref:restriction endonuclease subunit S n=1 Tax=Alcanivorax sp. IL2 TaxID=3396310 RepID=UPI0039C36C64
MDLSDCPGSWCGAELGEVCSKPQYGYTTKSSLQGAVKFLRTTDITKGEINWSNVPFCENDPEDVLKYQLEHRDIVISRAGSIGFSSLLTDPPKGSVFASYLIRFQPSEKLSEKFLKRFLESPYYWLQLASMSAGNAVQNVNAKKLSNIILPLPPLAEQKAIAEKLDTLLAQVESTKARLERIPKILKRFRQSVLAAAVSGKLTEEWRSFHQCEAVTEREIKMERESYFNLHDKKYLDIHRFEEKEAPYSISSTWGWYRAEEICDLITKGTTPKKGLMSESDKVPFVKVYNLTFNGYLDFSIEPTFVSEETHKTLLKRSRAYPGDVLMNIVGPPLGKVSILPDTYPEWNLNQAISIFRPVCGVSSGYLSLCLRDHLLLEETKSKAKATAGQFNLTLEICRDYAIPVPPKQEQTEIVHRVDQLFAYAETIETQVNNALERVNNLAQSILAKAFRGELTEQWRKDNPGLISGEKSAEALLEKIKAERAAAKPVKRGRKKAK